MLKKQNYFIKFYQLAIALIKIFIFQWLFIYGARILTPYLEKILTINTCIDLWPYQRIAKFIWVLILYTIFKKFKPIKKITKINIQKNLLLFIQGFALSAIITLITLFIAYFSNLVIIKNYVIDIYYLNMLPIYALLMLMTVFTEELIDRKYNLDQLNTITGPHSAIILAALYFGICHYQQYALSGFIYATTVGIALGYLYFLTGSIATCTGFHFASNMLMNMLLPSGRSIALYHGDCDHLAILTINLILMLGCIIYLIKKLNFKKNECTN